MKNELLISIFFFLALNLSSQNIELSGRVVDAESSEPLFYATILAGDEGTSTDFNGEFSLSIDRSIESIKISYVGYESFTYVLTEQNEFIDIALSVSDNLLSTAVVTGAKYEISVGESVVSIDVLKPKFLETTNTNDVEDILNKIPGIQMVDGQPNIRGGSGWSYNAGNRVMLLIDDIPALQPDAGRAQWSDIPVENIAQIEVIKGAGSTLYGSAAMNGVINVRTGYATSEPETKISIFHTRFDNYKDERKNWFRLNGNDHTPQDFGFSASHKQKVGKWDIIAAGYFYKQDSTKSYRNQDFRNKLRGNLNLRYRASDRISMGVNTIVNTGRSSSFFLWKNATNGALQPLEGTVTTTESFRYIVDPYITIYDNKDNRHRFQSRFYYNDNKSNLNQANKSSMRYVEYQFHRRLFDDTNLTLGVVSNRSESDAQFFQNAELTQLNYAGFFQLDHKFGDKLNLSGGLRYEYNKQKNDAINHPTIAIAAGEESEGQFIGRFGLNYEFSEYSFLRASFGQAYRFPILIERFLSTEFAGFVILPNPDLNSENGVTTEVGIKQGVKIGSFLGYLDAAAYVSRYSDMMEFVFVSTPLFGFQSQNIGDTEIRGVEVSIAGKMNVGSIPLTIYGGYNYANPTYQDFEGLEEFLTETSSTNENILKYRSRHSFTMDIQAELNKLRIGVAIQGASNVIAVDKILETFITGLGDYRRNVDNDGYQLLDGRIAYSFDNLDVSIHMKNILNQEYTQRPGIIEAPRNLAIRADIRL